MAVSFEEVLIEVWRQVLVENAKTVELGPEHYPVRQTPKGRHVANVVNRKVTMYGGK